MCPKTSRISVTMCMTTAAPGKPNTSITLRKSKMTHDVPFGEKFYVQEKIEVSALDGAAGVKVRMSGRVVFVQSCGMLQSKIQTTALKQLEIAGDLFSSQVKL